MKRWVIFIGRVGTVLITIGIALLLVSLIPPAQSATLGGSTSVPPKWAQTSIERVLTPQQGLRVTVTANGTLEVYLLEVSSQMLYQWAAKDFLNTTDLEEFLKAYPDSVGWHDEIRNGRIRHDYVPTKVTNATLILSNPNPDYVPVEYETSITSLVAPGTKVRNLAQWIIPIGLALALPWMHQMWKERTARPRTRRL